MAVFVQVIGRLAANAEVRTSKNGNPFVSFRMATDEYRGGNRETVWINVSDYSDKTQKMAQYLTKGSLVCTYGVESASIYTDRNGNPQISRDIRADRVDFVNAGKQNDSETTQTQTQTKVQLDVNHQAHGTEFPPIDCGTLKPQVSMQSSSPDDEDDLPF